VLLSILKFAAAPGSIAFLLLAVVAGLSVRYFLPRFRRLATIWLWAVAALYLVLSLPIVAVSIVGGLPGASAGGTAPARLDTLVVFDGDNRRGRVADACRLAPSVAGPMWVLGEPWMVEELAACGIGAGRLHVDEAMPTTRDQIDWVARLRQREPSSAIVVIASRLQAPRIRGLLAARGLDVALIGSPIDDEPPVSGWRRFVPSYIALRASRDAIYEHIALTYYRRKGWIQ
jgi:hypothetical protein